MNYYNEIKNKLIDNEVYSKVIGRLLNEADGKYGDNIIEYCSDERIAVREYELV